MAECSKDCGRKATRRGLCRNHYETHRTRQKAYGRWETLYVDADPVRAHVQALRAAGVGSRKLNELSGVSRTSITALMTGRPFRGTGPSRQVYKATADKLLAVPVPSGYHGRALGANIGGCGTTRRLQALVAIGYTQHTLCRFLGISDTNASKLFTGRQTRVTTATAARVAELYDGLSMTPGPSQPARNRAKKLGWPPPLAWDDIDDPDENPDLGAAEKVSFADRYLELRDLGYRDTQIADRFGIKPESLNRQLERHGVSA
jgi:transcriptional regulator with XRE-family HTH domain